MMWSVHQRKVKRFCIFAFSLMFIGSFGAIRTVSAGPEINFKKWVKEIKIKGDLRLRHELIDRRSPNRVSRQRQRYRFRLSADFKLPNHFKIKTRFASGTGEQTSTNNSFDNNSSQDSFFIDRVYLQWKPFELLTVQGGRMGVPLWTIYSSDVVWDGDYNPEGFSQNFHFPAGKVGIFFNALQSVVDEDSGSPRDQYLLVEQAGGEFRLPAQSRFKAAVAYHDYINERASSFSSAASPGTNRRTGGVLSNEFGLLEITGLLSSSLAGVPIALETTYVKNTRVRASFAQKEDVGVQSGVKVGKVQRAGSWEVAYFYKEVEADAAVDEIADSDFGAGGGTNRQGHLGWVAYGITHWMKAKIKYFDTRVKNLDLTSEDSVRRLQVDLSIKF